MCKCTPSIRTPFCGKPGCTLPKPDNVRIFTCNNCGAEKQNNYYKACEDCRKMWRLAQANCKEYWVFFLKSGTHIHGHNAVADYRKLDGFLGYKKIKINMDGLER